MASGWLLTQLQNEEVSSAHESLCRRIRVRQRSASKIDCGAFKEPGHRQLPSGAHEQRQANIPPSSPPPKKTFDQTWPPALSSLSTQTSRQLDPLPIFALTKSGFFDHLGLHLHSFWSTFRLWVSERGDQWLQLRPGDAVVVFRTSTNRHPDCTIDGNGPLRGAARACRENPDHRGESTLAPTSTRRLRNVCTIMTSMNSLAAAAVSSPARASRTIW